MNECLWQMQISTNCAQKLLEYRHIIYRYIAREADRFTVYNIKSKIALTSERFGR